MNSKKPPNEQTSNVTSLSERRRAVQASQTAKSRSLTETERVLSNAIGELRAELDDVKQELADLRKSFFKLLLLMKEEAPK